MGKNKKDAKFTNQIQKYSNNFFRKTNNAYMKQLALNILNKTRTASLDFAEKTRSYSLNSNRLHIPAMDTDCSNTRFFDYSDEVQCLLQLQKKVPILSTDQSKLLKRFNTFKITICIGLQFLDIHINFRIEYCKSIAVRYRRNNTFQLPHSITENKMTPTTNEVTFV